MTLVEFLTARLADDEAMFREAGVHWSEIRYMLPGFTEERVLADCQAKRQILELHTGSHECSVYDHHGEIENCYWVNDDNDEGRCSTVLLLARSYSNHPDFDPSWETA